MSNLKTKAILLIYIKLKNENDFINIYETEKRYLINEMAPISCKKVDFSRKSCNIWLFYTISLAPFRILAL